MPKLLLIVYDELLATAYAARFQKEGFEVRHCRTAVEGATQGRQWRPDAILVDIALPGMHGLDFLKWVTEVPELVRTPVALLTERTLAPEVLQECRLWNRGCCLEKETASLQTIVDGVRALLTHTVASS